MYRGGGEQRVNIDSGELFEPTVAVSSVGLLTAMACVRATWILVCTILILSRLSCNLTWRETYTSDCLRSVCLRSVWLKVAGKLSGKIVRLNKSLYGLRQASACGFRLMLDGGGECSDHGKLFS